MPIKAMAFTIDAAAISPYDVILVVTLVTLISYSYSAITGRSPKSNGLKRHYPLAGYGNERFLLSRIWNRLQWFKNGPTLIHDAYQKVGLQLSIAEHTHCVYSLISS